MRLITSILASFVLTSACARDKTPEPARAPLADQPCRAVTHLAAVYTVCTFSPETQKIRLFYADAAGEPFRQFDTLARELEEQGETLIFAMNGGMYHDDRRPVGFYRDQYGDRANVNTNEGPGNFHLRPNGVFWIADGLAGVSESAAFLAEDHAALYATQSGPMLVIDGALHPDFNRDGTSRKRRNGVGVSADGLTVHFAISEGAVTFHDFAALFRDALAVPNALFLDGQVSRLYATALQRDEPGLDMGPIVGVVE